MQVRHEHNQENPMSSIGTTETQSLFRYYLEAHPATEYISAWRSGAWHNFVIKNFFLPFCQLARRAVPAIHCCANNNTTTSHPQELQCWVRGAGKNRNLRAFILELLETDFQHRCIHNIHSIFNSIRKNISYIYREKNPNTTM